MHFSAIHKHTVPETSISHKSCHLEARKLSCKCLPPFNYCVSRQYKIKANYVKIWKITAHTITAVWDFGFCFTKQEQFSFLSTQELTSFLFCCSDQYFYDPPVQLWQRSIGPLHICPPGFIFSLMDKPEALHAPSFAACAQVLPAFSRTKKPPLAGVFA